MLMRNTSLLWCLALTSSLLLGVLAHMCLGEVPIRAFPNGSSSVVLRGESKVHFCNFQTCHLSQCFCEISLPQ